MEPAPTTVPDPDAEIPFIKGESGKEGWEAIKEDAVNAHEGEWVNVNMNGASYVPGDVIDSVKGQDVTISFDMGNGIIWAVSGRNVTADQVKDVDLAVQVGSTAIPQEAVDSVAAGHRTVQLSLAHSGEFGYQATLVIDLDSANAGLYANLFYYNESTGRLEFVAASRIGENGLTELPFAHASDYVIVVGEDVMNGSPEEDSSEDHDASAPAADNSSSGSEVRSPKTGEVDVVVGGYDAAGLQGEGNGLNTMWLLILGAGIMAVAGAIAFVLYKKENRED